MSNLVSELPSTAGDAHGWSSFRSAPTPGQRIKILSYNIQVGITTMKPQDYLLHSWKHILPHPRRFDNLNNIARLISDFDIVALQEVDAGSYRSNYINLTEYLAAQSNFPFWDHRVNRKVAKIAQHSSGLLSRIRPSEVQHLKLPGLIPGRGVTVARYGNTDENLGVFNIHLSLSRAARKRQLEFIAEVSKDYTHAIMMGDFNCKPTSPEMVRLFNTSPFCAPDEEHLTFPSWQPSSHIDHILVTPGIEILRTQVLNHSYSDHLPLAMEIRLPETVKIF